MFEHSNLEHLPPGLIGSTWRYFCWCILPPGAFCSGRTLGDNWMYLLEDGVADQRLLGSVFQPSAFGVLLVLSIYLFLDEYPYWAVICAALAASFHPTYLLGAAALTAAYVLLRLVEQAGRRSKAVFLTATPPHPPGCAWPGKPACRGWRRCRQCCPY